MCMRAERGSAQSLLRADKCDHALVVGACRSAMRCSAAPELNGKWVPSPAQAGEHLACRNWMYTWPNATHRGNWPISHGIYHYLHLCDGKQVAPYHTFESSGCTLAGMASAARSVRVLQRLRNRTLYFVGDSLTAQHFIATVCFLVAPLLRKSTAPRAGAAPVLRLPSYRLDFWPLSREHTHQPRLCIDFPVPPPRTEEAGAARGQLELPTANASICLVLAATSMWGAEDRRQGRKGHVVQAEGAVRGLAERRWLRSRDVVVANVGLHVNNATLVAAAVGALLASFAALPNAGRPRLLWRETAPQHFGGRVGGRYGAAMRTGERKGGCRPHNASDRGEDGEGNMLNRAVAPLLARAGVPILRIWRPSAARWMEHLGNNDCSHYCHPSGVLDLWVRLLLDWLVVD